MAKNNKASLFKAIKEGSIDVVASIIDSGADVNIKGKSGETPLHIASKNGNVEMAELLISKGADVNAKDNKGNTPIHKAAKICCYALINLFIEKGVDVNIENDNGKTCFSILIQNSNGQEPCIFINILTRLIGIGAEITYSEEKQFENIKESFRCSLLRYPV